MRAPWRSSTRYEFLLRTGVKSPADDLRRTLSLGFFIRKSNGKWYADVIPLIAFVNLYGSGSAQVRWARLASIMREARVKKLYYLQGNLSLYADRLDAAAKGQITRSQLFVREDDQVLKR